MVFGNSPEKRIAREADKVASLKEDLDALSWSRVLDIGKLLQTGRGDASDLGTELVSIAQSNISLANRLGVAPAPENLVMASGIEVMEGGMAEAAAENPTPTEVAASGSVAHVVAAPGEVPAPVNVPVTANVSAPREVSAEVEEEMFDPQGPTAGVVLRSMADLPCVLPPLPNLEKPAEATTGESAESEAVAAEVAVVEAEPVSVSEPVTEPEMAVVPESAVEPVPVPVLEPVMVFEHTPEPMPVSEVVPASEPEPTPKVVCETELEPASVPVPEVELVVESAPEPEPTSVSISPVIDPDDTAPLPVVVASPAVEPVVNEVAPAEVPVPEAVTPAPEQQEIPCAAPEPEQPADAPSVPERFSRFRNLYESRDGSLCVFEDEHGHLVAVDSSKLA